MDAPYSFIQWKGTDVCMDVHCLCGAHLHFDGDFAYYIQCPRCREIYEMPTHVSITPVPEAEGPMRVAHDRGDNSDGMEEPRTTSPQS